MLSYTYLSGTVNLSACASAIHNNASLQVVTVFTVGFLVALFSPVFSLALGYPCKSNLWQRTSRIVVLVKYIVQYV